MKRSVKESEQAQGVVKFNNNGKNLKSDFDELVFEFEQEGVEDASEQAMDAFIGKWIDQEPDIEVLFYFDPEDAKYTKDEAISELVSYWGYEPADAEKAFNKFFEV